MASKTKKTLNNIVYASALTLATLLPGCEKEDITPPKIKILSPLEGEVYHTGRIVPIKWEIEGQDDFKSALLYVNGGDGFPIPESGSLNWFCKMGENKVVVEAKDLNSNYSKDSANFYIWPMLIKSEDIFCK